VLIEASSPFDGSISAKNRVAVYLTDLLDMTDKSSSGYTIRNRTQKAYVPGPPRWWRSMRPRYRESLYALSNSQLSADDAARLKCSGETPIEVAKGEIRSPQIEPGQETSGIVAIKLPPMHAKPTVLRLTFLGSPKGPINARWCFEMAPPVAPRDVHAWIKEFMRNGQTSVLAAQ